MALLWVSSWRTCMANSCGRRCTEQLFCWLFFTPPSDTTKSWLAGAVPGKTIWVRDHRVWLSELPRFNEMGVLCWDCLQVEGCVPHSTISFLTRTICLTKRWWNRNQPLADTEIGDRWVWWNTTSPCWNLKACKCDGVVTDTEVADRSRVLDLVYYLKIYQCRIWTMPELQ